MILAHHITLALTKKKQQKPDENDAISFLQWSTPVALERVLHACWEYNEHQTWDKATLPTNGEKEGRDETGERQMEKQHVRKYREGKRAEKNWSVDFSAVSTVVFSCEGERYRMKELA